MDSYAKHVRNVAKKIKKKMMKRAECIRLENSELEERFRFLERVALSRMASTPEGEPILPKPMYVDLTPMVATTFSTREAYLEAVSERMWCLVKARHIDLVEFIKECDDDDKILEILHMKPGDLTSNEITDAVDAVCEKALQFAKSFGCKL